MKLLDHGYIMNQSDYRPYPYEMIRLNPNHLDSIMKLQEDGEQDSAVPQAYFPITRDEQQNSLGDQGITLGIFVHEQLIAFFTCLFPGQQEDNLAKELGFSGDDLNKAAHLEAVYIHPFYRRNALQRKMSQKLVQMIREYKVHRYLFETVAPSNLPSLCNTCAINMLAFKLKPKYNNGMRYIFFQDLWCPILIDQLQTVEILLRDVSAQELAFNAGYAGFKIRPAGDETIMILGKAIKNSSILTQVEG